MKELAYVINLGMHLTTNKQPEQFPMYRLFKKLQNCLSDIMTVLAVNVCFGVSSLTLPDSDVGVCNGALIVSVLGHMFIIPSAGKPTTQRSSLL